MKKFSSCSTCFIHIVTGLQVFSSWNLVRILFLIIPIINLPKWPWHILLVSHGCALKSSLLALRLLRYRRTYLCIKATMIQISAFGLQYLLIAKVNYTSILDSINFKWNLHISVLLSFYKFVWYHQNFFLQIHYFLFQTRSIVSLGKS